MTGICAITTTTTTTATTVGEDPVPHYTYIMIKLMNLIYKTAKLYSAFADAGFFFNFHFSLLARIISGP